MDTALTNTEFPSHITNSYPIFNHLAGSDSLDVGKIDPYTHHTQHKQKSKLIATNLIFGQFDNAPHASFCPCEQQCVIQHCIVRRALKVQCDSTA